MLVVGCTRETAFFEGWDYAARLWTYAGWERRNDGARGKGKNKNVKRER